MQQTRIAALSGCLHRASLAALLLLGMWAKTAQADGVLGPSPETNAPLGYTANPMVLLTMSRDHTLFNSAYSDRATTSGNSSVNFNLTKKYVGLFNSNYCYNYTGPKSSTMAGNDGLFRPVSRAVAATSNGSTVYGQCVSSGQSQYWSGNLLNYLTTSRIDALRVALYGGSREVDTADTTILRRAYIPRDPHAWAVQYDTQANKGYHLAYFSPLSRPILAPGNVQHNALFGNMTDMVTQGGNCTTLNFCSAFPPILRVVRDTVNTDTEWMGSYRYLPTDEVLWTEFYLGESLFSIGNYEDYAVRVSVCEPSFRDDCKAYTDQNGVTSYKPTGVLHTYGESGQVTFGLLTGSYDKNFSGGRLRKNISPFTDEVNSNGTFSNSPNSMVTQINAIRIRDYNNSGEYDYVTYAASGEVANVAADFGSPTAEMMYEGLRYFKGANKTDSYNGTNTQDAHVGLMTPDWVDPYTADGRNVCAKPIQWVINGVNSQMDSDQLPGGYSNNFTENSLASASGTSLNVTALADAIGATENINNTSRIIGETPSNSNRNPTLKLVPGLGQIRGLPNADTMTEGSYYAASVAHFGKRNKLRAINGINIPTIDTYAVSFDDPFSEIVIPFPSGRKVKVSPFARTVYDPNVETQNDKTYQALDVFPQGGYFQTNYYNPYGGKSFYAIAFAVNFSGPLINETGKSRIWAGYYITASTSAGVDTLKVEVRIEHARLGYVTNAGYTISGTTKDGTYLVAQSENNGPNYFLNVPGFNFVNGGDPYWQGYCDPLDGVSFRDLCAYSPFTYYQDSGGGGYDSNEGSIKRFTVTGIATDVSLKSPLWYAAKWGGYSDGVPPTGPTVADPENYLLLKDITEIKTSFSKILQRVLDNNILASGRASSGQQIRTQKQIFSTSYITATLTGALQATTLSQGATGTPGASAAIQYTPNWTATFPAANARNIYYLESPGAALAEFRYSNLSSNYSGNITADIVNYLRGDQSNEVSRGGSFRSRQSLMGTIINSEPNYSQNTGMVYVGSNDGMFHGFDAATGIERFAFVPRSFISTTATVDGVASRSILAKISSPSFTARYFVDGNIAVSDLARSDSFMASGYNYLAGFLGRGGKGLFGLPVNQDGPKTGSGAWEMSGADDDDMGYLLGKPVIEQLSDGTNVVLFGNGYNSNNNKAVLYVVRLADGVVLGKYSSGEGGTDTPNGLATPGIARQGGFLQYAYAGDYLGNVWRFDLTDLTKDSRRASNVLTDGDSSNITKLFVARDASGRAQPIVAPLFTAYSSNSGDTIVQNKRFVFFGTGSDLTNESLATTYGQTVYGLIDPGPSGYTSSPVIASRGNLRARTLDTTEGTFAGNSSAAVKVRSFSQPSAGDMANLNGWFMDLSRPQGSPSEKVYSVASLRAAATPTLVVSSNIVLNDACASASSGFLNAMDAFHGGALTDSYFDLNRNGSTRDEVFSDGNSTKTISSVDFRVGAIGAGVFSGDSVVLSGAQGNIANNNLVDAGTKRSSQNSRRIAWREIVK